MGDAHTAEDLFSTLFSQRSAVRTEHEVLWVGWDPAYLHRDTILNTLCVAERKS